MKKWKNLKAGDRIVLEVFSAYPHKEHKSNTIVVFHYDEGKGKRGKLGFFEVVSDASVEIQASSSGVYDSLREHCPILFDPAKQCKGKT